MTNNSSPEIAYAKVFETNFKPVNAYVRRRVVSLNTADDAVNEVFLVAWRRWDEISSMENPLPWLYRVACNVVRNAHRSQNRHLRLVDKIKAQPEINVSEYLNDDASGELGAALSKLSEEDQELLLLVAWEGLSHAELSVALGCSVNAVGLRVHRAKGRLSKAMDKISNKNSTNNERSGAVVDINSRKAKQVDSNVKGFSNE